MKKAAAAVANPSTSSSDHFATLGLAVSFALDPAALHAAYIAAQQASHPDRQTDPQARMKAVQRSADINIAYRVLGEPLSRAEYLLSLHGVRVNGEADTVKPSQALLMESMELRERLMEEDDPAPLKSEAEAAIAQCAAQFAAAYEAERYEAAAQIAMRWRFFGKFLGELRQRA